MVLGDATKWSFQLNMEDTLGSLKKSGALLQLGGGGDQTGHQSGLGMGSTSTMVEAPARRHVVHSWTHPLRSFMKVGGT